MPLGTVPVFEEPDYLKLVLFFAAVLGVFVALGLIYWIQRRWKDSKDSNS